MWGLKAARFLGVPTTRCVWRMKVSARASLKAWRVCSWGLTFKLRSIRSQLYDEDSLNIMNQEVFWRKASGLGGGCRWGVTLARPRRGSLETVTTGHHGVPDQKWDSRAIYTTAFVSHWVRATSGRCKVPDSSGFLCAQFQQASQPPTQMHRCLPRALSMDPWQHLLQLLILLSLQSAFMVEIFLQRKKEKKTFFPKGNL